MLTLWSWFGALRVGLRVTLALAFLVELPVLRHASFLLRLVMGIRVLGP